MVQYRHRHNLFSLVKVYAYITHILKSLKICQRVKLTNKRKNSDLREIISSQIMNITLMFYILELVSVWFSAGQVFRIHIHHEKLFAGGVVRDSNIFQIEDLT